MESRDDDLDITIEALEEILGITNNSQGNELQEQRLAAKINAAAVLDMITDLQDEIKVCHKVIKLLNNQFHA